MNLSLVVAIFLLALKVFAAVSTYSSAIYSDAAESVVHVFAVASATRVISIGLSFT
jgi:divalent metal cation (Fe/Co/Zn/Cd) transporter